MPILKQATCIILLVATPLLATASQNPADKKAVADQETKSAVEKKPAPDPGQRKILAALDQLLETSKGFADEHLRLKIQAEVGNLLWPYDEPRARRMFEEAYRDAGAMKLPHLEADATLPPQFIASARSRLRAEILRMFLQRDQARAEKLANSIEQARTNKPEPPVCIGCGNQNDADRQQLMLALNTIRIDPMHAMQLAKEGMSKGINPALVSLLNELCSKDPALGDELFVYALSVARHHSIYLADSFNSLIGYVIPDFGSGMLKSAAQQRGMPPARPAMIVEFLRFVHDAVEREATALQSRDASATDPYANRRIAFDYFIGEQTLVYFDRYLPEKTAAVRARLEDIIRVVSADEASQHLADFNRERTTVASLDKAKTETDAEKQQALYQQAIAQAITAGEFEQALAIIPKLEGEATRIFFDSKVRYQRAEHSLVTGKLEAAYLYANEVPDLNARAALLGRIATQFRDQHNTSRAAEVLAEAKQLFQRAADGPEKAEGMVDLVFAAMQINPDRDGFEEMRAAIEAINAANLAPQWTNIKTLSSQKTGKPFARTDVGLVTLRFNRSLMLLAASDFDRALQLAQTITLKEASVLAQLAVYGIWLRRQLPKPLPEKTKPAALSNPDQPNNKAEEKPPAAQKSSANKSPH